MNLCEVASMKYIVFLRYHNTCYLCKYAENYVKFGNNLFEIKVFKLHSQNDIKFGNNLFDIQ